MPMYWNFFWFIYVLNLYYYWEMLVIQNTDSNLTFRGPCIVLYSYNERQRDALFLKFMTKYSTCFGQVHCPSSGVYQHCIHTIGIYHASSVGVCQRGPHHASRDRQKLYQMNLRISASHWFSLLEVTVMFVNFADQ